MANLDELIQTINWQQPWYQTLLTPSMPQTLDDILDSGLDSVFAWLNRQMIHTPLVTLQGSPIQFVPQTALPANIAYESFIGDTGNICTRDNLHDLLNGLMWLNFPKTKAVLNYLHTLDIANNGIASHRSPLRNALTLFDENGGIVVSSNVDILTHLQAFNWEMALFDNRQQWQTPNPMVQFFPFGHALLEKLVTPRKNITSHVLLLQVKSDFFDVTLNEQRKQLDEMLAKRFLVDFACLLHSKNFQPLPVMGIAGFCNDNQAREFYQDRAVFREPREKKSVVLKI